MGRTPSCSRRTSTRRVRCMVRSQFPLELSGSALVQRYATAYTIASTTSSMSVEAWRRSTSHLGTAHCASRAQSSDRSGCTGFRTKSTGPFEVGLHEHLLSRADRNFRLTGTSSLKSPDPYSPTSARIRRLEPVRLETPGFFRSSITGRSGAAATSALFIQRDVEIAAAGSSFSDASGATGGQGLSGCLTSPRVFADQVKVASAEAGSLVSGDSVPGGAANI